MMCNYFTKHLIEDHKFSISKFHEGTTILLDEITQFKDIHLNIMLADLSKTTYQAVKSNFKAGLIKAKAIKSICMEIVGNNELEITRNLYDELIEGITHSSSLMSNLELQTVTVEAFEHMISLLIKWNSDLKLITLLVSKIFLVIVVKKDAAVSSVIHYQHFFPRMYH